MRPQWLDVEQISSVGKGVAELGGLVVIGTERMESQRIDLQIRGRSGRQGDPGMSKFFVSLEDDVIEENTAHLGFTVPTKNTLLVITSSLRN